MKVYKAKYHHFQFVIFILVTILLFMLFVWSVYFSIQENSANYLSQFTTCTNPLEYIGNTTHSVKGQSQESWEFSKETQQKFTILSIISVKNFSLVTFLAPEPRFMPNLETIPYLLIKFSLYQAIIFSVQEKCCLSFNTSLCCDWS